MSTLNGISADYLYFSACNTANPDVINIAEAFYEKNPDISIVSGWDGGVVFKPELTGLGFLLDYYDKPSKTTTFDHFADYDGDKIPDRICMGRVEIRRKPEGKAWYRI